MHTQVERGALYSEINWAHSGAETAVLLHGMGSCCEDWLLQRAALRGRYHCLCLDLPGLGWSRRLPGWPSVASLSGDVLKAIDRWAPTRPVHLVGLSLGAAIGLQLMVEEPSRIRSAVLVNGFASGLLSGRGVRHGVQRAALIATGRMARLGEQIALGLFPRPEQTAFRSLASRRIGSNPWVNYIKLLAAIGRFDIRARLGSIACPVLVVAGERDDTVPPAASKELVRRIPKAQLILLPGAKHAAPIDSAEALNRLLLNFLASVGHVAGPVN